VFHIWNDFGQSPTRLAKFALYNIVKKGKKPAPKHSNVRTHLEPVKHAKNTTTRKHRFTPKTRIPVFFHGGRGVPWGDYN
jgi:hypothetical protein